MNISEKTYVLVHGAWHGAWSFDKTKKILESSGAKAVTFDLPGHGNDKTKISNITLDSYVNKVVNEINKIEGNVILAGHSLSGFVVTKVAQLIPQKIDKLIYIAAMVPNSNKTVFDILNEDKEGQLLENLIFSEDKSWATVNEVALKKVVYNGATAEQISSAAPKLVYQATQPFFVSVNTEDASSLASLPKTYIKCEDDKILSPNAQQKLIDTCGIKKTLSIKAGHVPQVEKPIELATLLHQA